MSTTQAPDRPEDPAQARVTEADARAVTEAAREKEWTKPSFAKELFLGNLRMELIHPYPRLNDEEEARTQAYLEKVRAYLETVDANEIDRTGRVPREVREGMAELGLFGLKIPGEYGGVGLTQQGYNRTIALVSTKHAALGVLLSAHQSIGVPQPLKMFGSDEQKRKYLPMCAKGAVSAFALTEADVGSDPARLSATAEPTDDGSAYILNGDKLWTTNGPIADVMVVMARTPARDGGSRRGITAFIVEADWEGVEAVNRLEFMGLNGIENGVIRFNDVRVPKENVLWGEGKGLKLALTTLNTGRLTIPATCAAAGKWCLQVVREWSKVRKQWGAPIGEHDAIAQKIGQIAATTFAMESVAELSAALADEEAYDIRLEAAIAKMWNSEAAWRVVDETMQIRGGRGYETADSLASRGEEPIPVEQLMRDLRINLIFEGSSEIMRLFIAREAVDPHLSRAEALFDDDASAGEKAKSIFGLGTHMTGFMAGNMIGWSRAPRYGAFEELAGNVGYIDRRARKLARTLGWAMARFGPSLEKRQSVLFRLVDVGADLFAMAATCSRAAMLVERDPNDRTPLELAGVFCRMMRRRIDATFDRVFDNDDTRTYRLAQDVLAGEYRWLERGILPAPTPEEPS